MSLTDFLVNLERSEPDLDDKEKPFAASPRIHSWEKLT